MGKLILVLSFLFSLNVGAVSSDESAKKEVLSTIEELLKISGATNYDSKISQMCDLVKRKVDNPSVTSGLLGSFFYKLTRDQVGITKFTGLMPSIIVDQFSSALNGKSNATLVFKKIVPKGSKVTGVQIYVGEKAFVVSLNKANNKIVDVEYGGASLVKTKGRGYQSDLRAFYDINQASSLPVTELVNKLEKAGVRVCR